MIEDFIRRAVERAIHEVEHPRGMGIHDGKARIEASYLRRMLAMLDAAPTPPVQQDDEVLEVLRRIVDVWGSPWPSGADPMQDVMRDACALLEKRGAA